MSGSETCYLESSRQFYEKKKKRQFYEADGETERSHWPQGRIPGEWQVF